MQIAIVCNSAFGTDGISMFVVNNHRFFGHENERYHLIYSSMHSSHDVVDGYVSEWCKDGDKARFISKGNGVQAFSKVFYRYLKKERIDVLHVHGSSAAILLEMVVAKWAGVKKIVTHSHNTRGNHNIIHKLLRPFVYLLADERLACGKLAGQWMYGKHQSFTIIPNCVDTNKYIFDDNVRKAVRKELGIGENAVVLGHVGTFTEVKNQTFLLYLMRALKEQGMTDYMLILIGHGSLKDHVMEECEKLGLNDVVMFLGNRNDVPRIMMAMDVFCMPSLYEGFPVTAVEAQATGLPMLISANVSPEVCITDMVKLLPIDKGTRNWEDEIRHVAMMNYDRKKYAEIIKDAGYDIHYSADLLQNIYKQ